MAHEVITTAKKVVDVTTDTDITASAGVEQWMHVAAPTHPGSVPPVRKRDRTGERSSVYHGGMPWQANDCRGSTQAQGLAQATL